MNPGETGRGATKTKTKINRGKFRHPGKWHAKEQHRNQNRESRGSGRRQEMAVGHKGHDTGVPGVGGAVMEILMKRGADGQGGDEQP